MKVQAKVRFNAYNFSAESGDVIEFEREEDAQMLLNLGWVEVVEESKGKSKKKDTPTV